MDKFTPTENPSAIGFRNANNNELLSISESLLTESRKRFTETNRDNLLETKNKAIKRKKIKYKNDSRRHELCSNFAPQKTRQKLTAAPLKSHNRKAGNDSLIKTQKRKMASKSYPNLPKYNAEKTPKISQKSRAVENVRLANKRPNYIKKELVYNGEKIPPKQTEIKKEMSALSENKIVLSPEQNSILGHVIDGKSVFFTGCAGTGKTVLLREICSKLKHDRVNVHVTASTGLAAHNLNGKTLHSWSGIGFGKGKPEDICRKIRRQTGTFSRWKSTRVLIIDEISMISADIFDLLDTVAKKIRQNKLPFGGVQLVLCGDFLQLPPVNAVKLVFEASAWPSCIPDKAMFELKRVYRQKDKKFVAMLNELRRGVLSDQNNKVLADTAVHQLPKDSVVIYSHRKTVEKRNATELKKLKGRAYFYEAEDSSPKKLPPDYLSKLLSSCPIPSRLSLKVGAPVIIMKNIDESLVNGLSGVITGFEKESEKGDILPVVYFKRLDKTFVIERVVWSIKRGDDSVLASRKQLPINLCWALTIHKCQGMTLDSAAMDLGSVWEPGHFYVAVSRLRSISGLKIVGKFNKKCVKANPKVLTWMTNKKLIESFPLIKQQQNLRTSQTAPNPKVLSISEKRMSTISKPFLPLKNNQNSPLSYFQKRALNDKARRRKVDFPHSNPSSLVKTEPRFPSSGSAGLSAKQTGSSRIEGGRRFSISDVELANIDSLIDDFEKSK